MKVIYKIAKINWEGKVKFLYSEIYDTYIAAEDSLMNLKWEDGTYQIQKFYIKE